MGERVAYDGLSFPGVVSHFRMLVIFTLCKIVNVWDTASAEARIHPLSVFLPTDYLFEKRIGQVTKDL